MADAAATQPPREQAIEQAARAIAHWHTEAAPHIIRVAELRCWLEGGGPADTVLTDRMTHSLEQLEAAAATLGPLIAELRATVDQ